MQVILFNITIINMLVITTNTKQELIEELLAMPKTYKSTLVALSLIFTSSVAVANTPKLDKMSAEEIAGKIFQRSTMVEKYTEGSDTLDVTSLLSSDKKFISGMYQAGSSRLEIKDEPYGVDEFMYFLKGSVKLTSEDGTVQVINAGEAVTIPKEWKGIWETEGYTKIYVIYSPDSELE